MLRENNQGSAMKEVALEEINPAFCDELNCDDGTCQNNPLPPSLPLEPVLESLQSNCKSKHRLSPSYADVPLPSQPSVKPSSSQLSPKQLEPTKPETQRDKWDNQIEFLLSCVSMSVGLGNVWRFPFIAYENGGGAFIIPYFIVLIVLGRPIYYLEMCLGQFTSFGPVKVWEIAPFFRGVGYASMLAVFCIVSFYCSIMAVTIHYFISSFSEVLPWSEQTCNNSKTWTDLCDEFGRVNKSFSELYYFNTVFPQYDNIENGIGTPHWKLCICLVAAWMVVYLCIVKGIKSAGKVSYFTALFPYIVLIVLLIRGLTLPGAIDGVLYFIEPQWDKLLYPKVWFAAVSQCFFSLNVGFGTIIFLSSHNEFRHNVFRDAVVISITDTFTSCLAGCSIFAMLGYLAKSLNVHISTVSRGGPGLAFIAFPESLSHLDWFPQVFSVLFFLMIFVLGVGSALALVGQLITIICDQFPSWRKWKVGLLVCTLGLISGIVYITPGGQFILTLVNHNGADFIIYMTAMTEIIAISWVYGVNNFINDIKFMLGRETQMYWKICWAFIMPLGLFTLLVYYFARFDGLTHDGVKFPRLALGVMRVCNMLALDVAVCGWILSGVILSTLPICAIQAVFKQPEKTLMEKLKASLRPKKSWGPKSVSERMEWLKMKTIISND